MTDSNFKKCCYYSSKVGSEKALQLLPKPLTMLDLGTVLLGYSHHPVRSPSHRKGPHVVLWLTTPVQLQANSQRLTTCPGRATSSSTSVKRSDDGSPSHHLTEVSIDNSSESCRPSSVNPQNLRENNTLLL